MKKIINKSIYWLMTLLGAFFFLQMFIVFTRAFFILGGGYWNEHLLYWTIFMPIWEFFAR